MRVYHNCYFFHARNGGLYIDAWKTRPAMYVGVSEWWSKIDGYGNIVNIRTNEAVFYPAADCRRIQGGEQG